MIKVLCGRIPLSSQAGFLHTPHATQALAFPFSSRQSQLLLCLPYYHNHPLSLRVFALKMQDRGSTSVMICDTFFTQTIIADLHALWGLFSEPTRHSFSRITGSNSYCTCAACFSDSHKGDRFSHLLLANPKDLRK